MRLFITGGSGFLGRNVIRIAQSQGHTVTALARSSSAHRTIESLGAQTLHGDLENPLLWRSQVLDFQPDTILHLSSMGMGLTEEFVNSFNVPNLRAIFVSTTAVTTLLPAPSKRIRMAAEQAVRSSELSWTILRPTMIYGQPGDRNIERLLKMLPKLPIVPIPGNGQSLQQPVHVEDLAHAVITSASSDSTIEETLDIAGPRAVTFATLIALAQETLGQARPTLNIPIPFAHAVAAVARRIPVAPSVKAEQIERLEEDKQFDISQAFSRLNYSPRSLATGLAQEVALLNRAARS